MQWELLVGVPEPEVRLLLSIARRRRFKRGEVVFHQDDPGDSLHLVASGRFAVRVRTPVGEIATIAVCGPGQNFGEMALIDDSPRSATVAALEPAETFAVFRDDFNDLRARHSQINDVLIAFLAAEVRSLDRRLLEALYLPVERRVRRRLLELAEIYGTAEIPLTQEELAEFVGAARATVNRVLREEQERGVLELRRGVICVLDVPALTRSAR